MLFQPYYLLFVFFSWGTLLEMMRYEINYILGLMLDDILSACNMDPQNLVRSLNLYDGFIYE
jgi:hypothetical protein